MEVALTRCCERLVQDTHESRREIALAIIECARSGKTNLGDLTTAGESALDLGKRNELDAQ